MKQFFLLLSLMVLPGCFSLAHDEPPQHHFVLGGPSGTAGESAGVSAGVPGGGLSDGDAPYESLQGLRIGLRKLQMVEYLDSPLIVVRVGQHQIVYSEFNRWGGSLESGVMRALESHLEALAPLEGVATAPWDPRAGHDYLVQIHLLGMEGLVPEAGAGAEGASRLLASWEIISPIDGAVLVRGRTNHTTSGWTAGDYNDLVGRFDAGLWELSRDLVAALAAERALLQQE